ncbi:MAG: sialidase family protein [Nitrososphaeraceae archaeon]
MWNGKHKVSLLTLGIVVSYIGLIQTLTHPLDLRASNDGESGEVDLLNQSRLIEFDDIVNLTNNNEDSVYGQVGSSNNNTYVVWQESVPGNTDRNYEIFFKKSSDDGNSFGERIQLSDNIGFSEHPQMASENNNVYVVWADDTNVNKQIYFKKSNNGGNSFGEQMLLSDGNSNAFNQEISSFGDNVYVVWLEKVPYGPYRIMLASSNDGANTFHKPITLSENAVAQTFPKISSFDGHVYVAWNVEDLPNTRSGVYFISSTDNGMTFGNISKLNMAEKDFGEPQIASSGNQIYVIWGGSDTNKLSSLSFIKSDDNGRSFSELRKINETEHGRLNEPSNVEIIADQNERVFIAWQDRIYTSDKDEIFFASSTDRGETFNGVTNLSNNADISECPSIIAVKDTVFATWEDLTPGNHEVFFSRGTIL